MHALDGERMLTAWEEGRERQEPWRALALLRLALPESDDSDLAALPLAERNALLLQLRASTFGNRIEGFAVCPECGAQLEFDLNANEVALALSAPAEETWLEQKTDQETRMRMRPVNSSDLAAAMAAIDESEARALLLARTMALPESADPAKVQPEWMDRFERLNASAEIQLLLPCAACGAHPTLDFDIARFLWREVATAARRLFTDIHLLARAYGWSEQAIAAMTAARRTVYLEMLDA